MNYVVPVAFLSLFLWAAHRLLYLHVRGLRTTGILIDLVADEASEGPVFNPVVRFTTSSGVTLEVKSSFGVEGVNSYYRIGQQVPVRYLAKKPWVFAIEGYDSAGVFLLFLLAAGVGALFYWGR
jgi:hypothetical protein